jgi:polysaccharide biosynthesis/export protein
MTRLAYKQFCRFFFVLLFAALPIAAAAQTSTSYLLGPGDMIEVSLVSQQGETTKTRINADNTVVLPLIGRIMLGGKSLIDAQTFVEQNYREGKFLNSPIVRIDVVSYESQKISVLGQVFNQGLLPLDRPYTITEIIARAGGLTAEAGDTISLVRPSTNGQPARQDLDMVAILSGERAAPLVQPGDVVFVPRAATVSVVGAVSRAGVFKISRGMTVQQAVAVAGDVTRVGALDSLRVRRLAKDGSRNLISVALDGTVQDGDVIIIKERLF